MPTTPPGQPELFENVLHAELDEIAESRRERRLQALQKSNEESVIRLPTVESRNDAAREKERDPVERAHGSELLGLAFSGGGIRSATFNLGILQGLAKYRLLQRFDYLSTVSGGGYIGSWLTAWIKRQGLQDVQKGLALQNAGRTDPEPHEITFLRQYSNYLTPQVGAFSADTWTMISIYLRDLLLNLIILVFGLGAVVAGWRLISILNSTIPMGAEVTLALAGLALALVFYAAWFVGVNLRKLFEDCPGEAYPAATEQGAVQRKIVLPTFVAVWALSSALVTAPAEWALHLFWFMPLAAVLVYLAGFSREPKKASTAGAGASAGGVDSEGIGWLAAVLWAAMGGAVAAGSLYLIFDKFRAGLGEWALVEVWQFLSPREAQFVWGVPLVLTILLIGGTLYIGLMSNRLTTKHREWWGRVGAWFQIYSLGWLAISIITLCGPWLWGHLAEMGDLAKVTLTSGWLGTIVGGLWAGSSDSTGKPESNKKLELLAQAAPPAFVLGLLLALSAGVDGLMRWVVDGCAGEGFCVDWAMYAAAVCVCSAVAYGMSRAIDINEFSMHHFYRDRLARCYLGASNPNWNPHPFTGFDPAEHYIRISDLLVNPLPDPVPAEKKGPPRPSECCANSPYIGPYHIANTAMNLVSGKNLAWQNRLATSFVMTPKYCGYAFRLPGQREQRPVEAFRPTRDYKGGVSLATAVAISGAAASPNMGYHTSKPLAFLMTVLNVRLGWWFGNPKKESWAEPSPPQGLAYLLAELFGLTNEDSDFVYLSDGGHFENLGIYELVRRRCRFIIACDAGQDGEQKFEDLGNAIEKCRTDLGIDIEITVDPIRCPANSKMSKRHCAVGTIHYERMDPQAASGILVYIKASLTGDEQTDVLRYSSLNEVFPHQSTGDQFFDESQFESYRALGEHIAEEVLDGAGETRSVARMSTYEVFLALKRYWYPSSVQVETHFTKHAAKIDAIYKELRTSKNLAFLSHQIYPEWRKLVEGKKECEPTNLWLPDQCDEVREGFYICNQVIQLMESVYMDLDLDQENDHPDNRGWMNFFRHWSWSGMFRVTWAISAATFGARFQTFCERHLDLTLGEIDAKEEVCSLEDNLAMLERQERRMMLNFFEVGLLEGLIRHDRESKSWLHPLVLRVSVPSRPEFIEFPFGVGLTYETAGEEGGGNLRKLRFFRVQDHLRQMGFGREGLRTLMLKKQICHLDISRYPGDGEDGNGPFASPADRMVLRTLFESVKAQLVEEKKLRC